MSSIGGGNENDQHRHNTMVRLLIVAIVIGIIAIISSTISTNELRQSTEKSISDLQQSTESSIDELKERLDRQFEAENFDPDLNAQGSEIMLMNEMGYTSRLYTDKITINAISNNYLKFKIKDVKLDLKEARCYFESEPVLVLGRSEPITLEPGKNTGVIEQNLQIDHTPSEAFLEIDTSNLPEYGYNRGFPGIYYTIEVYNMQTKQTETIRPYPPTIVWMSIPPEKEGLLNNC